MNSGKWETQQIQSVSIEHADHPIRRFIHRLLPTMVSPPPARPVGEMESGDKIVFLNGKKAKLGMVIRTAEGTRYAFSDRPLPGHVEDVSVDANTAHLDITQVNGTTEGFTVPTKQLIDPTTPNK